MTVQYYGISINNYGEVILGLMSASTFKVAKVSPARNNKDAFVIKLFQHQEAQNDESLIPLRTIEASEVPAAQKLKVSGYLMEVAYPWGTQFIEQLESLVVDFDLESYQDPFKEGSDSYGLIVGRSEDLWNVAHLLDERSDYCDENPDDEDASWTMEDNIVNACSAHNVIWLDTDWKHFEIDISDFDTLGLQVDYLEPSILNLPEGLIIDQVQLGDHKNYTTINLLFQVADSRNKRGEAER